MERERVDSLMELAATIAGKADSIEDIVVLYTIKDEAGARSLDNGCTVGDCLFLMETFKHWLMSCMNQPKDSR